jgi:hypothetical protein
MFEFMMGTFEARRLHTCSQFPAEGSAWPREAGWATQKSARRP